MEDKKVIENAEFTEVAEVKENKFVSFMKRHGKKIAAGAALAGAAALGFVIGQKIQIGDETDYIDDAIETEFTVIDDNNE